MQDWDPMILNKKTKPDKSKDGGSSNTVKYSDEAHRLRKIENNDEVQPIAKVSHNLKLEIQKARTAKKLSQKQLANLINQQESVVKDYESGKAIPDNNVINKLSKALGVKLKK